MNMILTHLAALSSWRLCSGLYSHPVPPFAKHTHTHTHTRYFSSSQDRDHHHHHHNQAALWLMNISQFVCQFRPELTYCSNLDCKLQLRPFSCFSIEGDEFFHWWTHLWWGQAGPDMTGHYALLREQGWHHKPAAILLMGKRVCVYVNMLECAHRVAFMCVCVHPTCVWLMWSDLYLGLLSWLYLPTPCDQYCCHFWEHR